MKMKWSPKGRTEIAARFDKLKELAKGIFHYSSDDDTKLIEFIMLPAIALRWNTENPLWLQVIGSPGSGKTAHISFYEEWVMAAFVSRLTKHSLISGYRPEGEESTDPSFLPKIDGKLLVVKDFTCMLQGPREERDAVIGQLRDIYDGHASAVFGNVGLQTYKSKFNMLLAVTNVIDGFHGVSSQLGERFLSRREFSRDRMAITEAAFTNLLYGRKRDKFAALAEEFISFIEDLPAVSLKAVEWPPEFVKKITEAANFVALARSHVIRESGGKNIASRPSPEVGSRLVTQVGQCIIAYCVIHGYKQVNEDAWQFGARIMFDTLPTAISYTLYHILKLVRRLRQKKYPEGFTIAQLLPKTRLGFNTTTQIVTDLHHNGILDAKYATKGMRSTTYFLRKDMELVMDTLFKIDAMEEKKQFVLSEIKQSLVGKAKFKTKDMKVSKNG